MSRPDSRRYRPQRAGVSPGKVTNPAGIGANGRILREKQGFRSGSLKKRLTLQVGQDRTQSHETAGARKAPHPPHALGIPSGVTQQPVPACRPESDGSPGRSKPPRPTPRPGAGSAGSRGSGSSRSSPSRESAAGGARAGFDLAAATRIYLARHVRYHGTHGNDAECQNSGAPEAATGRLEPTTTSAVE